MTPVPFTQTLCVLAACTFVRRFTWKAGAFMHSHTYQSGQTFYRRSHSKSVSEFSFPLFLSQISCRERLLRLRIEDIQALFLQVLAYRSIRTQPESMGSFVLGDGHRAFAVSAKSGAWNRVWGTWSGGRCRLPIPSVW